MNSIPAGYRIPIALSGIEQVVEYFLPAPLSELRIDNVTSWDEPDTPTLADLAMLPVALRSYPEGSVDLETHDGDIVAPTPILEPAAFWQMMDTFPFQVDARALASIRRVLGLRGSGLRQSLSWVGGSHPATAWLVPPPVSAIPALLDDLLAFANRRDVHPRVRLALLAHQFIHIHPFVDGNGRSIRMLLWLLGRKIGATAVGTALSLLLSARKDAIGRCLVEARLGNTTAYFQAVDGATQRWRGMRSDVNSRLDSILVQAFAPAPERNRSILARALLCFGYFDVSILRAVLGATESLAGKYLRNLSEQGGWLKASNSVVVLPELERLRTQMAATVVSEASPPYSNGLNA